MNEFEARWATVADAGHAAGRFRVYPDHVLDFYVQYSLAGRREMVIEVIAEDLPNFELPAFRNIDVVQLPVAGGVRIGMTLAEEDLAGSFSVMCYDLAERSKLAPSVKSAAAMLLRALDNWAELFRRLPHEGLTRDEVLGLKGELIVLEALIADTGIAPEILIHGWRGPHGDARDIGLNGARIEVKAQRSTSALRLRISSLNQLDDRGERVFVVLTRLTPAEHGRSLLDLVAGIRELLRGAPLAMPEFERKIALSGMSVDAELSHEPHSEDDRVVYAVTPKFPRLVPSNVPVGVSAAEYEISGPALDACRTTWSILSEAVHG